MSLYITKEDIYTENGILLISKGQKVSGEVIQKIRRLRVFLK